MAAARLLNQPFRKHARTGRPWVLFKSAMSLDGKVATHGGDSKWISGESSRMLAHYWRAECDAVVVGIGTVRREDDLRRGTDGHAQKGDEALGVGLAAVVADDDRAANDLTPAPSVTASAPTIVSAPAVPPSPALQRALEKMREVFHIRELRPGQAEIMESVLAGRDTLAIEPVSHVNNAINLVAAGADGEALGLHTLQPGETLTAQMSIEVERRK